MEKLRSPFQGVFNIVRFNWHFYLSAAFLACILFLLGTSLNSILQLIFYSTGAFVLMITIISLLVSFYIYDLSKIYDLRWANSQAEDKLIVNINAGFDETSEVISKRFIQSELIVFDFYDPAKHTEVSIKRARKAYPHFPKTKIIKTDHIFLEDNSADKTFIIFSAHEIRNESERLAFLKEVNRITKQSGKIYITEHLRDLPNFLAFNAGFFHFYSRNSWLRIFQKAQLKIESELKLTPFVSTFILIKNGNAS